MQFSNLVCLLLHVFVVRKKKIKSNQSKSICNAMNVLNLNFQNLQKKDEKQGFHHLFNVNKRTDCWQHFTWINKKNVEKISQFTHFSISIYQLKWKHYLRMFVNSISSFENVKLWQEKLFHLLDCFDTGVRMELRIE